jgi:hypothetical protein
MNGYTTLRDLPEDKQITVLNNLQAATNAAERHEPELVDDMENNVIELAQVVSDLNNRNLTFDGKQWS